MWAYLEQQSFPMSESDYRAHLQSVADALNRIGAAEAVRRWLSSKPDRPRLGKAMSLALIKERGRPNGRLGRVSSLAAGVHCS